MLSARLKSSVYTGVPARLESLEPRALFSAAYSFDTIALVNAPTGTHKGDTFSVFEPAGINDNGDIAFAAYINHNGTAIGEAVYAYENHHLTQFIRQTDLAPGGERYGGFGSFSPGSLNRYGDIAIGFGRQPATATEGVNAGVYEFFGSTGTVIPAALTNVTEFRGKKIQGTAFHASINDSDTIAFAAIYHTHIGPGGSGDLGQGILTIDKNGTVSDVATPGDRAPGGSTFDFAVNPSINDAGDVAFGGHISSDPVLSLGQTFPSIIFAAESIYLKNHDGHITSIAHQGAAIPASAGGGIYDYAFGASLNNSDQIVYIGAIRTKGVTNQSNDPRGVFLNSGGSTLDVARPGTHMPGGGIFQTASYYPSNYGINNNGQVVFNALLTNGQEGAYAWKNGKLSLIAKTGTVIPGVGTVASLDPYGVGFPAGGVTNNDHGQILFSVTLKGGGGAMLVANPAS